jgi:hypothetical protein
MDNAWKYQRLRAKIVICDGDTSLGQEYSHHPVNIIGDTDNSYAVT